jgi:hypothetical protein
MIQLVISLALIAIIVTYPVMLAARFVGAGRTGFGSALISFILLTCLSLVIRLYITNELVALLIAIIGGSLIYSWVLDTTVLRGFVVSILSIIIALVVILLLTLLLWPLFGM